MTLTYPGDDWVRDAFGHLKVIGFAPTALPLLERAGLEPDEGVVPMGGIREIAAFITAAKSGRMWNREVALRSPK